MARQQVWVDPCTTAFVGEPHLHGLRIGYAGLPEDALRDGLERLAAEIARRG